MTCVERMRPFCIPRGLLHRTPWKKNHDKKNSKCKSQFSKRKSWEDHLRKTSCSKVCKSSYRTRTADYGLRTSLRFSHSLYLLQSVLHVLREVRELNQTRCRVNRMIPTKANQRFPLTNNTTKQLYPHWNPVVPRDGMESEVASADCVTESMAYNDVLIIVSTEQLKWN